MEIPNRLLEFDWTAIKIWLCFAKSTDEDGVTLISDEEVSREVKLSHLAVKLYKSLLIKEGFLPCKGPLPSVNEQKRCLTKASKYG